MKTVTGNDIIQQLNIPVSVMNNQSEYIRTVREGIPGTVVRDAIKIIGNRELFIRLFNTTSANLNRYYHKKLLNRVDSEEVLDTLRIFLEATRIWGDTDHAKTWLNTSIAALAGAKPIDLFDTFEGRNWVRQVLRKIEHGEFS